MTRAYVIANPRAGRGSVARGWEALLGRLRRAGLEAVGALTEHRGHAVELARRAKAEGWELVVAVGGDGTVHEVVNGLLAEGPGPEVPVLGVVAAGSGCDYVKTFSIPADLEGAVARLASPDPPLAVDVGEVCWEGGRALFANIAEVGIGPAVVDRASRLPRALGGLVYLAGFFATLPSFSPPRAQVRVDGEAWRGRLTNLVVAVGRVFGGGMRVAPGADPSDGRFDVQVHTGSKADYVRGIPKVYRGTHLPHPRILQRQAAEVEVACDPPALVEADGEVLGRTPATFRVLPGALRLKA